jgi:hypothetical protein
MAGPERRFAETLELDLELGWRTNPAIRCGGEAFERLVDHCLEAT